MPITLYESALKEDKKSEKLKGSILEGIVLVPCDLIRQGKVLIRVPALGQEVWARLSSPGAGPDAGNLHYPREDDEVLVGFSDNDPGSAYILNGLWSTSDSPPISKNPLDLDLNTKRVIKTGLKGGIGHKIEFDDGIGQSITITTSTQQKIVLDKEKIELNTTLGSVKITLNLATQTVSIQAPQIEIGGEKTVRLKLSAKNIEIAATALNTITGKPVMIN